MKNKITTFIYMGDPQCSRLGTNDVDYSEWGKLLEKSQQVEQELATETAETETPERLLVLGGDIVNRRNRPEEWESFFGAYDGVNASSEGENRQADHGILVTPVNGSRESIGRYCHRFLNTGNGPAGYEKNFFSFDFGCCHFMVLDSDYMGNTSRDAYKYIGYWIKADLSVNTQPVVFAVMHHPMYTIGTSFEDDVRAKAMQENYMNLFHKYGVDFILCGHQHAYCRTREMEAPAVPQIMGVSGTKYFNAWSLNDMEAYNENVSVSTIFKTDGVTITLKTIDSGGTVIDEFAKTVRAPKERNCGSCDNYSKCGGTGEYERIESERKAALLGDPLKPSSEDGIVIRWTENENIEAGMKEIERVEHVPENKLRSLEKLKMEYSVMRRTGMMHESHEGFRLEDLLEMAGWQSAKHAKSELEDADFALVITSADGRQRILNLGEVLEAGCFEETGSGKYAIRWMVPALVTEENGGYRLICGQTNPKQYNGRMWPGNIRMIEIRKIKCCRNNTKGRDS